MHWLPLICFGITLCLFHVSEFVFAFLYMKDEWSLKSCLLSIPYLLAMICGIAEYAIESSVNADAKTKLILPGFLLIGAGEAVRKSAMIVAKQSFTHKIRFEGHPTNELVTSGPYRYMRHPGYFGWMVWALGTQVLLSNPVCAIGFLLVSWRFFKQRIAVEEEYLINYFGGEYIAYMRTTPAFFSSH